MLGLLSPRRRKPLPIRTPSSPCLTQEEIDRINSYPEDTGYTYARSISYSASFPREYTNPAVGYRHSLSNSGFEDERTYFTRASDFVYYLISSVLYAIYSSAYYIASYLVYGVISFTPLYYVVNLSKTANDVSAVVGIVAQFIARITQISYFCIKDFFLQTGYNTISLKNDIRDAFWNALGYRVQNQVIVEEPESDTEGETSFVRRHQSTFATRFEHRQDPVSWPRRFLDSIIYVTTFGHYPARLANAGVVPPARTYHRTSGFGNKGFLARSALKIAGFAYYIVTAEFLFEDLEPINSPVAVRTRRQLANRTNVVVGERRKKFRWGLFLALVLGLTALILFFGFGTRKNQEKRHMISPAGATESVDEGHYPSLHLTESLRPTVELAYTKGLEASEYVIDTGSNIVNASANAWSRFTSRFLSTFDEARKSSQAKTANVLENGIGWSKYVFGKILAIPRLLLDLILALISNVYYLLKAAVLFVVDFVRSIKDVLLNVTFKVLNTLYVWLSRVSQKAGAVYDSVPSVDTVAVVNNVNKNFGAVVGKNGYLHILWEQFLTLFFYVALQLWNLFSFIVLLPYNIALHLLGSEGYISQLWHYIFSTLGQYTKSISGVFSYIVRTPLIFSKYIADWNEQRRQLPLPPVVVNEVASRVIDDEDFEARVLAIVKKHYASLPPPTENTVIHFNDETLHNRIFPAISQYVTANPKFLESAFKKYLDSHPIEAAPQKFDIDAKISSIVAKDHKNQQAVVVAAIEKYLSAHIAKIVSDYHAKNPAYLADLIKTHLTANPLIKDDELRRKIETIVKDESVIKVALTEQLQKLQSAVASPTINNTSGLSVAYLDNRLTELYTIFDAKLRNYSYDRTGEPDYALESSGGFVVSTRCTEEYDASTRRESIFGIPLWYTQYSPRFVIQRPSANLNAGECWAVKGQSAFLVVQLARPITVSSISYEHLPKALSPDGNIDSAPKKFKIWSLQGENDPNKVLIGHYYYDENGEALQRFAAVNTDHRGTPMIEFELTENYGAAYTCIYRLRVHGTPL